MTDAPFRIMLAEDNRPDVFLIRQALQEAGLKFELQTFDDGEAACEFLEKVDTGEASDEIDLLLLDLNLPKKNGEQVLERLRKIARMNHVPVVILTSSDSAKDRAEVARLGGTLYLTKPCDLEGFMQLGPVIRQVLDNTHSSRNAQG
ncbi:MAG TPA: response regulator [Bryobacteraceae bacterium]|nr:response regulator [Bryobacteraceae bacterium]